MNDRLKEAQKWLDEHPRSDCCEVYAEDIVGEFPFHAMAEFLCNWCIHRHGAIEGSKCEDCICEYIEGDFNFEWDGNRYESDSNASWFRQVTNGEDNESNT